MTTRRFNFHSTGQSTTAVYPQVGNKTLDAEYYRGVQAGIDARRAARQQPKLHKDHERHQAIAADLRVMTIPAVMAKWRISMTTIHKVRGEMDLGHL